MIAGKYCALSLVYKTVQKQTCSQMSVNHNTDHAKHLKKKMVINVPHLRNFLSWKTKCFNFHLWLEILFSLLYHNGGCSSEETQHNKIFQGVNLSLTRHCVIGVSGISMQTATRIIHRLLYMSVVSQTVEPSDCQQRVGKIMSISSHLQSKI